MSTSSVGGGDRQSFTSIGSQETLGRASSVSESDGSARGSMDGRSVSAQSSTGSIFDSISSFFSGVYNYFAGFSESGANFDKMKLEKMGDDQFKKINQELQDAGLDLNSDEASYVAVAFSQAGDAAYSAGLAKAAANKYPENQKLQELSREADEAAHEAMVAFEAAKEAAIDKFSAESIKNLADQAQAAAEKANQVQIKAKNAADIAAAPSQLEDLNKAAHFTQKAEAAAQAKLEAEAAAQAKLEGAVDSAASAYVDSKQRDAKNSSQVTIHEIGENFANFKDAFKALSIEQRGKKHETVKEAQRNATSLYANALNNNEGDSKKQEAKAVSERADFILALYNDAVRVISKES